MANKKASPKSKQQTGLLKTGKQAFITRITQLRSSLIERTSVYLARRPHRSFRRTRRRDYSRSLELPGYWSFTFYVLGILRANRRLFALVILTYAVLGAVFVGLASQDAYSQLSQLLDQTGGEIFTGGWGAIGQAGLLLFSGLSGSLNLELTEAQQIYSALILLLTWLTTVWLLRAILAGKKPRLRDGLYNAGSPIVSTGIVLIVALVQLLPATIGVIVFSSAMTTNLFDSGFMAMIISLGVGALILLSSYWVVSTIMALIIVTLPGMYPWQAVRTAGDLVIGRRLRLLLRIIWMMLGGVLVWIVVVLPVILLIRFLTPVLPFIATIPIVPIAIALITAVVIVWSATYMYLLYRKVVEDDAKPA